MFQSLVGDVLVVVDVFEIKWWTVHEEYNGTAQWSGRVILIFCQILNFLRQSYAFSKFLLIFKCQKARKPRSATFSSITICQSRFPTKKKKKNKKKTYFGR